MAPSCAYGRELTVARRVQTMIVPLTGIHTLPEGWKLHSTQLLPAGPRGFSTVLVLEEEDE